jgi:hypothetical protein
MVLTLSTVGSQSIEFPRHRDLLSTSSSPGSQSLKGASGRHFHVIGLEVFSDILPRNKSVQFTLPSVQIRAGFSYSGAVEESFEEFLVLSHSTELCDTCRSTKRVAHGNYQVRPHSALNYRPPAPEAIVALTVTRRLVQFRGAGHRNDPGYVTPVIWLS